MRIVHIALPVVPENSIRQDSRGETESPSDLAVFMFVANSSTFVGR